MSSKQQKLKCMEKPGLGYGQKNANPFSIRYYALMSRQQNIMQSWPFSQKYLKLCLKNGINNNNILPPLQTRTTLDGLHGRLVVDLPQGCRKNSNFGRMSRTKLDKTEKILKPLEDLEVEIPLLCEKLGRLSLSYQSDTLVGSKRNLVAKLDNLAIQRFKAQTSFHETNCDKGKRRKGKRKMKSLVDILAVAKRCVLKGSDKVLVSAGHKNGDERHKRKVKGVSRSIFVDSNEGFSSRSMKKHRRCDDDDDYVTEISQYHKRNRATMEVIDHKNDGPKFKSWSRKMCRTAETEKKAGGYERKASKHMLVSFMELQGHHGTMHGNY